jgi:hypothetical protein
MTGASPFQRLRLLALPLVIVGSLLACSSAPAAPVTVGSRLTASFLPVAFNAPGLLAINSALGEPGAHVSSPVDGAVIGWKVLGEGGPFELRLVRPEGAGTFIAGAASAPQTIPTYGLGNFTTDLPIKAGETVGIQATNETDRIGTTDGHSPGSAFALWVVPPVSPATLPNGEQGESELSFSATVLPAPTIGAIGTTTGPLAGGTSVTVSGTDFTDVQSVSFGSVPAAAYSVTSEGQITAVAPAAATAGAVPISVTTEAGTAISPQTFTYVAPTPPAPPTPPATSAAAAHCVVPKLKGRKLKAAKKAIKAADCKLGKVTKKGTVDRSARVVKQKPKAGTTRAPGSRINVVLGGK